MHFSGHTYDSLGSLPFFIQNFIHMARNPPFSPGHPTPTYSMACFFCSPIRSPGDGSGFSNVSKSLNKMWNVQLFRMRPITAILVHWLKRYGFWPLLFQIGTLCNAEK